MSEQEVGPCQTWAHKTKGVIHGVDLSRPHETWMRVRLVGDHQLRWFSPGRNGEATADGEILTLRRDRMRLIPDDVPGETGGVS